MILFKFSHINHCTAQALEVQSTLGFLKYREREKKTVSWLIKCLMRLVPLTRFAPAGSAGIHFVPMVNPLKDIRRYPRVLTASRTKVTLCCRLFHAPLTVSAAVADDFGGLRRPGYSRRMQATDKFNVMNTCEQRLDEFWILCGFLFICVCAWMESEGGRVENCVSLVPKAFPRRKRWALFFHSEIDKKGQRSFCKLMVRRLLDTSHKP